MKKIEKKSEMDKYIKNANDFNKGLTTALSKTSGKSDLKKLQKDYDNLF